MRDEQFIERIQLPVPGLEQLQAEAHAEGYKFLDTLLQEWVSGENRFNGAGEALCGCLHCGDLVAVGGLNRDPFISDARVARIRRIYVRRDWRNRGLGSALLDSLLRLARANFRSVRLRAENPMAIRLYESRGFGRISSPDATHILHFNRLNGARDQY